MKRRNLLGMFAAAGAMGANSRRLADCGCAMQVQHSKAMPPGSDVFKDVGSNLRITNMRVFGVTLDERIAQADRPYVFVKLETNQGVVGWGEATLEGKASAAMACVMDLKDYIIGQMFRTDRNPIKVVDALQNVTCRYMCVTGSAFMKCRNRRCTRTDLSLTRVIASDL